MGKKREPKRCPTCRRVQFVAYDGERMALQEESAIHMGRGAWLTSLKPVKHFCKPRA